MEILHKVSGVPAVSHRKTLSENVDVPILQFDNQDDMRAQSISSRAYWMIKEGRKGRGKEGRKGRKEGREGKKVLGKVSYGG